MDLVLISTNEVFDGRRTDGRGYRPDDPTDPPNPYGASKLAGELAARDAFAAGRGPALAIVRTAWLFGRRAATSRSKILAAAERARAAGEPLRVVGDEYGSPTYAADLAEAIVELLGSGAIAGTHHFVNLGAVSRADWARDVLRLVGRDVAIEEVPASTWAAGLDAAAWAVLEPTPAPVGRADAPVARGAGRLRPVARPSRARPRRPSR